MWRGQAGRGRHGITQQKALIMTEPMTIEGALSAYRTLVEKSEQAMPVLTVGLPGDGLGLVALDELAEHPTDALSQLVSMVQFGAIERPIWAVFATEAYMQTLPDTPSVKGMHRGELAERAQAGDNSVHEVVICHHVSRVHGLVWSVTQEFKRLAALGAVLWEPWVRMDSDDNHVLEGAVPQLMAQLVGVGKNYG